MASPSYSNFEERVVQAAEAVLKRNAALARLNYYSR